VSEQFVYLFFEIASYCGHFIMGQRVSGSDPLTHFYFWFVCRKAVYSQPPFRSKRCTLFAGMMRAHPKKKISEGSAVN